MPPQPARRVVNLTILVAALGYFVDIYDLILFTIVRVPSLKGLGLDEAAILDDGLYLLNMQMGGMLVGGVLWGILGDKRGRLSVLFGSIFLYSAANVANGLVQTVPQYAVLRFIAGVGLAGELGAGITLVSEIMHRETRGYGTTLVATMGILGGIVAALIGDHFSWRTAYFIGGGLGFLLLLLRIGLYESGMFEGLKQQAVRRGNFLALFATRERAGRYLAVILVGLPIWYVVGLLVALSPELGKAMEMDPAPNPGRAVLFTYIGLATGDFVSGLLSQLLRSRKRVLAGFLALTTLSIAGYFTIAAQALWLFYAICGLMGFAIGYWAVFVTVASEQFGTNLRATVTTTAPNFVRGAVVPVTVLFRLGKEPLGVVHSALIVGVLCLFIALLALRRLDETFGRDLDFLEH
jgi:predicted MFS family arabinose efflux permease